MEKIQFKNLPDTSTPLSAENLNKLQDNIEKSTAFVGVQQPQNQEIWFKKSNNILNYDWFKSFENYGISITRNEDVLIFNGTTSQAFVSTEPKSLYLDKGQYYVKTFGSAKNKGAILIVKAGENFYADNFKLNSGQEIQIYLQINDAGSSFSNDDFRVMIASSNINNYEKYVKKPEILTKSNNEYETFDVSNCEVSYYEPKGKQVWFRKSENLFNLALVNGTDNNFFVDYQSQGGITLSYPILIPTSSKMSFYHKQADVRIIIQLFDSSKKLINQNGLISNMSYNQFYQGYFTNENSLTFSLPNNVKYIKPNFTTSVIDGINVEDFMLNYGEISPYKSYVEDELLIKSGNEFIPFNCFGVINDNSKLLTETIAKKIEFVASSKFSNHDYFGGCWYYKIGTRVHLHLGAVVKEPNVVNLVYTMPKGYRPRTLLSYGGIGGSVLESSGCQITKDGDIYAGTSAGFLCIDCEYDAFY